MSNDDDLGFAIHMRRRRGTSAKGWWSETPEEIAKSVSKALAPVLVARRIYPGVIDRLLLQIETCVGYLLYELRERSVDMPEVYVKKDDQIVLRWDDWKGKSTTLVLNNMTKDRWAVWRGKGHSPKMVWGHSQRDRITRAAKWIANVDRVEKETRKLDRGEWKRNSRRRNDR